MALAAAQHGLLTRRQLRGAGFDRNRIRRWEATGRLRRLHRRTFLLAGAPETQATRLMGAVLETGEDAAVSHSTAAHLWSIPGFPVRPTHVVVTRWSRHHTDLPWVVHQFTDLPERHRTAIDGIPVTSPALTMLHLAATVGRTRLEQAVDSAWNLGLITGADLADIDRFAVQGRNGVVALRAVAAERGEDWTPPQSNLESRFMRLMERFGRHDFERQVPVRGDRWTARVDFLHRPTGTVIEVQSERYHTALSDVAADHARRRLLEEAGLRVVEVWDRELFEEPDLVVDRVTRALHT